MIDMNTTENCYESSPDRPFPNGRAQPQVGGYTANEKFESNSIWLYIRFNPDGSIIAQERALGFAEEIQAMKN